MISIVRVGHHICTPSRITQYDGAIPWEKGDRSNLCEAPSGPFRQIGPVPFFPPRFTATRSGENVLPDNRFGPPSTKRGKDFVRVTRGISLAWRQKISVVCNVIFSIHGCRWRCENEAGGKPRSDSPVNAPNRERGAQCFNIRAVSRPSGRKPSSLVSRQRRSKQEGNRLSQAARALRITAARVTRRTTRPRGGRTVGAITSSVRNCERSWNAAGKGPCVSAERRFCSNVGRRLPAAFLAVAESVDNGQVLAFWPPVCKFSGCQPCRVGFSPPVCRTWRTEVRPTLHPPTASNVRGDSRPPARPV